MTTIKIYTSYNERSNSRYYTNFELDTALPKVEDLEDLKKFKNNGVYKIEKVWKDLQQGSDLAYMVDCYECHNLDFWEYDGLIEDGASEEDAVEEATEIQYIAIMPEIEEEPEDEEE